MKEVILSLMLSTCPEAGTECPKVEFDGLTGATVAEKRVGKETGQVTYVIDDRKVRRHDIKPRQLVRNITTSSNT